MKLRKLSLVLLALLLAAMAMVPMVGAYQASTYGTNYGDGLDTSSVAQTAKDEQNSMGYSASRYLNSNADSAFSRMASDNVFFFDGHGAPGRIIFKQNGVSTIITGNNLNYPRLSSYVSGELNDVALAVYMACETANTNSINGNLLDESTARDIDTAIGFSNNINSDQSGYWSNRFWYYLDERYNINDASVYATSDTRTTYYNDAGGLDSYVIRGSLSSAIDPARAGY